MGLSSELKQIDPAKHGLHILTDKELYDLKRKLLEITAYIGAICEENRIEWGLCGGSALGAIRHKGFIPWDDDIDICMTRRNFEHFKKVFRRSSDSSKYELLVPGDNDYYYHFPRIFDTTTLFTGVQSKGRGTGVFVDIFIVEDMYDNRILQFLHGIEASFYLFVISCMATHIRKDIYLKYATKKIRKKTLIRDFFSHFFSFWSMEKWIKKGDRVFSKVNNPSSKLVCVPSGVKHYFGEIYRRRDMCQFTVMPFEDKEFPVYSGVHNIMRQRYGDDYMKLPPEEKREKHVCIEFRL